MPVRYAARAMTGTADELWMDEALRQAELARQAGEVPVGAVIILGDATILGRGFNQPIGTADPTAHAEILAIREAARAAGNYRLTDATLYATIEPCLMCVGAIVHARIGRVVYGAADAKSGAVVSTVRAGELPGLNHRFAVAGGVREAACRQIIQAFFRERRSTL
jgi:tRNA(adenine34) deaminase